MLTVNSVPMRQKEFTWTCPLVSGPPRGKKTYLAGNGMKVAFLNTQKEI